jgi:hypothetical protein
MIMREKIMGLDMIVMFAEDMYVMLAESMYVMFADICLVFRDVRTLGRRWADVHEAHVRSLGVDVGR